MFERKTTRRKRLDYLNDYQKNISGEYIYKGDRYDFYSKSGKERKRWTWEMLLLNIAALLVVLIPGFILVPGMNGNPYVLVSYGANIVAAVYMLVAVVRLADAKGEIKEWEYDKSVTTLPVRVSILMVLGVVTTACEIIYLILHGAGELVLGACVFIFCHILSAAAAFLMSRLIKDAEWKKRLE